MAQKMKHTMGERLNICFNRKIKLEFHGARLISDGGLLAYWEFAENDVKENFETQIISAENRGDRFEFKNGQVKTIE